MQQGTVVRSMAGRDKGGWFAVLEIDGDFALIADGRARPLQRPKRKRIKHLAPTKTTLDAAARQTNRRLKAALRQAVGSFEKEVTDLG